MANTTGKNRRYPWLPVVAAIIRRDRSILLGKRPPEKFLSGLWEFPGGKIEMGESPEKALKRELKEELDIDAEIGELKFATTHSYSETAGVLLLFYEVTYFKGEPKALYHTDIRWYDTNDLPRLDLPDANRIVLDRIAASLK